MGGYHQLPITPYQPQQFDPLDSYAKFLSLKNLQTQGQMQGVQLQQAQMQLQDQQKMRQIMSDPSIDWSKPEALGQMLNKGAQAGVSPQMLQQIRNGNLEYQQKLAAMNKDQQDIHIKNLDQTRGELAGLMSDPNYGSPQSQQRYQSIVQRHVQAGDIQDGQFPNQLPPKEALLPISNSLALGSVQAKEASEQTTANARQQQAQTSASLAPSEISRNTAQATLATTQNAQAGQVTPRDQYQQAQENYRATLSRQATMANELQKNGLSQLDKMFTDPQHGYTQFLAQAQSTKNTIASAKNGDQLASSMAPLMTALGVTSFAGIHRINDNEINAAGPQVGSVYRRVNAILDRASSGKLPADTTTEMNSLIDGLIASKHASLVQGAQLVARNNGLDPSKTSIMGRDGSVDTLQNVTQKQFGGPPKGYVRIQASDGSLHDIPQQNLGAARQRDPNLQVVQ